MNIRPQQIQTFQGIAWSRFEDAMVEHLRAFAPKLFGVVGEPGMHAAVKLGLYRAHQFGFTLEGPMRLYLELMCTLGSGFGSDPQMPWASETLLDGSKRNEMLRADALYKRQLIYRDEVLGPGNAYAVEAVERLLGLDYDEAARRGQLSIERLPAVFERVYPRKFAYAGEQAVTWIIQHAQVAAARYALPGEGIAVVAGLQFALGHEACSDPFYPWIARTLADEQTTDGRGKVARLVAKARVYGQSAIAHLAGA